MTQLREEVSFTKGRIIVRGKLVSRGKAARMMASNFVLDQAIACATGVAQKAVPLRGLRKILVPLEPLAEQHRIVAKIDADVGAAGAIVEPGALA
jgi:hypothetical protein